MGLKSCIKYFLHGRIASFSTISRSHQELLSVYLINLQKKLVFEICGLQEFFTRELIAEYCIYWCIGKAIQFPILWLFDQADHNCHSLWRRVLFRKSCQPSWLLMTIYLVNNGSISKKPITRDLWNIVNSLWRYNLFQEGRISLIPNQ